MKRALVLLCLFWSTFLFAQYENIIDAYVFDKATNQPIPYVNIGFIEKSIGTVSDENGRFSLIFHDDIIADDEVLQFSTLGYKTLRVTKSQLLKFLNNTNKFYLTPQPLGLDEVLITNEKRSQVFIGSKAASRYNMGYWKDKEALGGEITTRVKINKKKTQLLNLSFNILENTSDSLKIRVNVYENSRHPGENILKQNIFKTITQKEGEVNIDLSSYEIEVNKDIIVGIELIEVYGDNLNFALAGSKKRGVSFTRLISQDKWKRFSNTGMHFKLKVSYPVSEDSDVVIEREVPKKLTIYWDKSLALQDRDITKEIKFLKWYFKTLRIGQIEVIKFNGVYKEPSKKYWIKRGLCETLISDLKTTLYDGASGYAPILKDNNFESDVILLFTNGITQLDALKTELYIPTFCVNSMHFANHNELQELASYADGHYINLSSIIGIKDAVKCLENEIPDDIEYEPFVSQGQKKEDWVYGKVSDSIRPIQGASVKVKNSFKEVWSDVDGNFFIDAKADDVLVISSLGMKSKEVVLDKQEKLSIVLENDAELLNEIVLTAKRKAEKEVETGFGKRKKDALGYAVETITSDDIKPYHTSLAQIITGRFAGVKVAGLNIAYNTPKFIIRGGGGGSSIAYAMFDIDGMIYTNSEDLPPIDVQQIHTITVLKSVIASVRYGTVGNGGAIVIRMKYNIPQDEINKPSALVKGNDYVEENLLSIEANKNKPKYIKALENASSFVEAKKIYKKQDEYRHSISYFIDVHEYFLRWDKNFAVSVLSNILSVANDNPKALKVLAYKFEHLNKPLLAAQTYERIKELCPNQIQSYRDLASIYVVCGAYDKAANLYKLMLSNTTEGVDFSPLTQTIDSELKHLVSHHRSKIVYKDLPKNFRSAKFKYDIRIVFEWTDPLVDFDVQFVNPNKKFYRWSHTMLENSERLKDEVKQGYFMEEFIVDDAESGEWMINVENFNEEHYKNPVYLKYTIYKNYGLASETKTTKVVKLDYQTQKVLLDKFWYQKSK